MSLTRELISAEVLAAHRARWFVYAGGYGTPLTKIPHQASMRGHWPGWDVECSCGQWASKTGGAIKSYVADMLLDHRMDEQAKVDRAAGPTADDIVTRLVQAPDADAATEVIANVSRGVLLELADLLYIDAVSHGSPWLRKAIVTEARA